MPCFSCSFSSNPSVAVPASLIEEVPSAFSGTARARYPGCNWDVQKRLERPLISAPQISKPDTSLVRFQCHFLSPEKLALASGLSASRQEWLVTRVLIQVNLLGRKMLQSGYVTVHLGCHLDYLRCSPAVCNIQCHVARRSWQEVG